MADVTEAEWVAAYQQLDAAVMALHRLTEKRDPEPPAVPVDYVLVVGAMWVDEYGQRSGATGTFPKDGFQPAYITKGLLHEALDRIDAKRAAQ